MVIGEVAVVVTEVVTVAATVLLAFTVNDKEIEFKMRARIPRHDSVTATVTVTMTVTVTGSSGKMSSPRLCRTLLRWC